MKRQKTQPPTRRFNGKTYYLLEIAREVCPGRAALVSRWEDYTSFRTVIGVDGKWAVYGLSKTAESDRP